MQIFRIFAYEEISMGYIHCCGALRKTRTFRLVPQIGFLICEVDVLTKCPTCGHMVVQLTKITSDGDVVTVRKTNQKAENFFERLKQDILYEIVHIKYTNYYGRFYLNYNEYGVIKRCYSNLSNMKLGTDQNLDSKSFGKKEKITRKKSI